MKEQEGWSFFKEDRECLEFCIMNHQGKTQFSIDALLTGKYMNYIGFEVEYTKLFDVMLF